MMDHVMLCPILLLWFIILDFGFIYKIYYLFAEYYLERYISYIGFVIPGW